MSFMRKFAAVLGTVLATAFTFPASATVRISRDSGGQIGAYLQRFESLRLGLSSANEFGADIKIPIVLAVSQCPTSRDFVPWRFSAAGRP